MEELIATQGNNTHHPFSPSKLWLYAICPASYIMQDGIADDTDSAAARMGTKLHAAAASGDTDGLYPTEVSLVEGASSYAAQVAATFEEDVRIFREQRLEIKGADGELLTYGTADVVIVGERRAAVIDYKFGRVPVPNPSHNAQLAAYALGVMQTYGVAECEAHIYQPLTGEAPIAHTFTNAKAIADNIAAIIAECKSATPILASGQHCSMCRAFPYCGGARRYFGSIIKAQSPAIPTDPNALATLWGKCKAAERYIADVRAALLEALRAEGGRIGKWQLKEVSGRKQIEDLKGAYTFAVSEYIDEDRFFSCCSVSASQLIQAIADAIYTSKQERGEKTTLKQCKADAEAALYEFIVYGQPTAQIVEAR